jgi:hypothetical protein
MQPDRDATLETVLRRCITSPARHRLLLDALSLMENMGAQKIHRFQRFGFRSEYVLQHAAEEARHALFFKQQANRILDTRRDKFGDERLNVDLCSRQYLRRLDVAVNRYIKTEIGIVGRKQRILAYLLVTFLIEIRANHLYPTYERLLREAGSPITLRSIIAEERRHLQEIDASLRDELGDAAPAAVAHLQGAEDAIYCRWLTSAFAEMVDSHPPMVRSRSLNPPLQPAGVQCPCRLSIWS